MEEDLGLDAEVSHPRVGILTINLPHLICTPGEPIRGTVYFKCVNSFCGILSLRMAGEEKVEWKQLFGTHRNQQQFYNNLFELASFSTPINPGNYAFPFVIHTSPNFQGTVLSETNLGRITYLLVAEISNFKHSRILTSKWLEFAMIEPRKDLPLSNSQYTSIQSCCCFKGIVFMSISVNEVGGRTYSVNLCIDNRLSREKIEAVWLRQVMIFKLTSRYGHTTTKREILGEQRVPVEIAEYQKWQQTIKFEPKNPLYPSSNGSMIVVSYQFEAECEIGSLSRSSFPRVSLLRHPIVIERQRARFDPLPNTVIAPTRILDATNYLRNQNPMLGRMNQLLPEY